MNFWDTPREEQSTQLARKSKAKRGSDRFHNTVVNAKKLTLIL